MDAQTDIVTITLNPAVDVSTHVARVVAGPKLRCTDPRLDPGGGGVNVARTVRKLGGSVLAVVAVGGASGDRLLQLLAAEDVLTLPVFMRHETRESFAVTDDSTGGQFRFSVPGQRMNAADADRVMDAIERQTPPNAFAVISGSLAPGLPAEFMGRMIAALAAKGARSVIDTSKHALDWLMRHPATAVDLLRIDQSEAEDAAAHPMASIADNIDFARDLIARGVAKAVVTGRGAEGSVLVSQHARFLCHAPVVRVRSKIGAGDAFVGAMTLALARGAPPEQALRWGVAAASATVTTEGTALCELAQAEACLARCQIEEI